MVSEPYELWNNTESISILEDAPSVSHQLVPFFFSCETHKKKETSRGGLFPDFQLRVHMHCPGQVSIYREMKRKKNQ